MDLYADGSHWLQMIYLQCSVEFGTGISLELNKKLNIAEETALRIDSRGATSLSSSFFSVRTRIDHLAQPEMRKST